jgi:predicted anti-sigma-YlaC factor YlaD
MIHARLRRRLSEYLDGSLPERQRAAIAEHLPGCASCRGELEALRRTVALLRDLPSVEPPDALATRILAQIAEREAHPTFFERARRGLSRVARSDFVPALGSVAALLVIAAVLRVEVDIRMPAGLARVEAPRALPLESARVAATPLAASRRFEAPQLSVSVRLARAGGVERSCLATPHIPECRAWHETMVQLALFDPARFLREVERVPPGVQERWLGVLSSYATREGYAPRVVSQLRASGDPRAAALVVRFQSPDPPQ